MVAKVVNSPGATRSLRRTKTSRSPETLTPDEAFLDDIRVSMQEIDAGDVLDSRQRIRELRAKLKDAKADCRSKPSASTVGWRNWRESIPKYSTH